eukprot:scaffold18494_cov46-Phaeocystis_antarctica.AAC.2
MLAGETHVTGHSSASFLKVSGRGAAGSCHYSLVADSTASCRHEKGEGTRETKLAAAEGSVSPSPAQTWPCRCSRALNGDARTLRDAEGRGTARQEGAAQVRPPRA